MSTPHLDITIQKYLSTGLDTGPLNYTSIWDACNLYQGAYVQVRLPSRVKLWEQQPSLWDMLPGSNWGMSQAMKCVHFLKHRKTDLSYT